MALAAVGEIRDGFKFRGGSLALDFPATLAARLRAEPRELLQTPYDLGRWLVAAGLAASAPPVTEEELKQARELREALYRLAMARLNGKPLPEPDRALLNRWAAGRTPAPCLEADGMSWTREDAPALLSLVAREAVETSAASSRGGSGSVRARVAPCCLSTRPGRAGGSGARCQAAETRPRWRASANGREATDRQRSGIDSAIKEFYTL